METMLLAGDAEFDLDYLCSLLPEDLAPEVQDKVAGTRHLVLKGITPTDEELADTDNSIMWVDWIRVYKAVEEGTDEIQNSREPGRTSPKSAK